jgi:hypothetical protein
MAAVAGCSLFAGSGQPSPIWGYRIVNDRTLSVLASTGEKTETWVASVQETPTTVVIEVRSRSTGNGAGGLVAQDIWLTVKLDAPLGTRSVIDADGNAPVGPVP